MADTSDKEAIAIAARVAVARWRRGLDDVIGQLLDQADECVQEASLMNANLPAFMAKRRFTWETVLPIEIKAAKIQKVRQYAGLVLKKMHRAAVGEVADLSAEMITAAMGETSDDSVSVSDTAKGIEPQPSRRLSMEFFSIGAGLSNDEMAALQ